MIDVKSMELFDKTFLRPNDYNQTNRVAFAFMDKFRNTLTIYVDLTNNGAITDIYLGSEPLPRTSRDFELLDDFFVSGVESGHTSNHDLFDALSGCIPNKIVRTIDYRSINDAGLMFQPRFNEYTGQLTGCSIINAGPVDARLRFTCQSTGKDYDIEVLGDHDEQVFKNPEDVRAVTEAFMTGDYEVETPLSRARADSER